MSKKKLIIEYAVRNDKDQAVISEFNHQVLTVLSQVQLSEPIKMYWVSEAEVDSRAAAQASELPLSKRQWEIAVLLCKHYSVKRIADSLYISENTVKKHIQNIKKTLEIDASGADFLYQLYERMSSASEEV